MKNLVIDSGNTRIKYGIFIERTLIKTGILSLTELTNLLTNESFNAILFSSVSKLSVEQLPQRHRYINLNYKTPLPITISYETPQTLGTDRLAAAVAAAKQFPGTPVLNIDTGTCIKYNFVNENAAFLGGAIAPGITMRYKALNYFTEKLPLLDPDYNYTTLIGKNTQESIHSGIIMGVLAEIEQLINLYKNQYNNLNVIVSGGDTGFLTKHFKKRIFASPNLVLLGLNEILLYNTTK